MTFDYSRAAASSLRLLERFGQIVILRRVKVGEYDPATGQAAQKTTDYEGVGAFFDYAQRDIDGTLIREGDQRVLMAPTVPRPLTGDAVVVPAVNDLERVFNVVQVRVVEPAGVPVLYELQVRA